MLKEDFRAYSGVWLSGWRLWIGDGPPISDGLRHDLDAWIDGYGEQCYDNGDEWISASASLAWHREGWRLFVRLNRELGPKGYVVLPAFGTARGVTISEERSRKFMDAEPAHDRADPNEVDEVLRLIEQIEDETHASDQRS
jgi:hypothetical protein